MININKSSPNRWNADIACSVDLYNRWFMEFAPKAYLETRNLTTEKVKIAFEWTHHLNQLTVNVLRKHPSILPVLRMSTCPPLARDRLINLAGCSSNFVKQLEIGKIPSRIKKEEIERQFISLIQVISKLLDPTIISWMREKNNSAVLRAASVIADRLCGSEADPIIRNAQEQRQLLLLSGWLEQKGYGRFMSQDVESIFNIPSGTYGIHYNVPVEQNSAKPVQVSVDLVINPFNRKKNQPILLIEAKSAGDFTNVNKRRKEEAQKMSQLKREYGSKIEYLLFLCGYFDAGYLGYEAAEGIDWIWEHRMDDSGKLGL